MRRYESLLLDLPPVSTTGTGSCSAHATIFPRRPDEAAALRIGRDLGRVLEALAAPTNEGSDDDGDDDDERE